MVTATEERVPPLMAGDKLTRDEFIRRWEAFRPGTRPATSPPTARGLRLPFSVCAAGNRLAVGIAARLLKLARQLFAQGGPDEVLETLGRLVQMVERQLKILAQIGFP